MAEDDYDDYYSDSEGGLDFKIPDIGDEYRGLVAPITEEAVRERRRLLRERRVKRDLGIPQDQRDQIIAAYRSIYGKNPESLLLRQPHTEEDYDDYGNLRRISTLERAAQRKNTAETNKNRLRAEVRRITGKKDLADWEADLIAGDARRTVAASNRATNRAIRAAMRQKGILKPVPKEGTPEY